MMLRELAMCSLLLLMSCKSALGRAVPRTVTKWAYRRVGRAADTAHATATAGGHGGEASAAMDERGIVTINIADATATAIAEPSRSGRPSKSYDAGQWLTLIGGNASRSYSSTSSATSVSPSGPPGKAVVALGGLPDAISTESTSTSPPAATGARGDLDTTGPDAVRQNVGAWVDAHNAARAQYSVGELTWDDGLAQKAMDNAKTCGHQHSPNGAGAGENIAWISIGTLSAQQTVDMWMSEEPLYPWDKPGYQEEWGHFTQVVWKSTSRVGCYVNVCGAGSQATCHYDPVGNWVDDFAANVLPGRST